VHFDPQDLRAMPHPELVESPGAEAPDAKLPGNTLKAAIALLLIVPLLPLIYAACRLADWLADRRKD
jgi:hypothetical protein